MTLPERMTVIAIRAPGGPEMLRPEQRPVPNPGAGEILVKVAPAGVNRPDVMQRRGLYPPPKGAPDIPGLEIAGTVAACGEGAARWRGGDQGGALGGVGGGGLKGGETLLGHGGSSGIGTAAIQLARNFGARVIVTAGSAEKCAACRKLGAGVAVRSEEHT